MANKLVRVRVPVGPAVTLEASNGRADLGAILDMLRYSGVLCDNPAPHCIEYLTDRSRVSNQIQRWATFGFKAEVLRER